MPRPGFYNDNEYRAYPFIFNPDASLLPYSAIVDCGIIMGLDSEFDGELHNVWLQKIQRTGDVFEFEFRTNAPGAVGLPLVFTRNAAATEWLSETAESEPYIANQNSCAVEPAWSGFLVTGPLVDLDAALPENGTITLGENYVLETARIQSLVKTYLRSISLGNLSRPLAVSVCDTQPSITREVIINKKCVTGNIRFKEGYNTQIRQRQAASEIVISAGKNLGQQYDAAICETYGEIPFYENELPPFIGDTDVRSKFLSGGPACNELVSSINGIEGPNVNIVGGTGIEIIPDLENNSLTINLSKKSIAGNC